MSKPLKGIDVCQIPKCDCSGRVNFQDPNLKFTANICPNCSLQGSSVSTEFSGATFNSTIVNLPQCLSTDGGTILNVTGFGTIIDGPLIVQGTFMFQLLESLVGDNRLYFTASGMDGNGVTISISAFPILVDEDLMINFCNSCNSSFLGMTKKTSKSHKLREEISKGTLMIIKNGQIEVKEL